MSKRTLILVLGLVGVVLVGIIVFQKARTHKGNTATTITYLDPKLSDADKKPFLDRLSATQAQIAALPKDAPAAQRYELSMGVASDYYALGELAKSRQEYLRAANLFPKEGAPWYSIANVEVRMQNFSAAQEHYKKAISLVPTNPEYWRNLLDLEHVHLGYSKEQVLAEIESALAATKGHADIITYKARYLDASGDLEGAVRAWHQAADASPANAATYEQEIKAIQARLQ